MAAPPIAGKTYLPVGTTSKLSSVRRSLTDEIYNVIRNSVNLSNGLQRLYMTDSYWIPHPTDTEVQNQRITQNEQNVSHAEDRMTWTERKDFVAADIDKADMVAAGDDALFHEYDLTSIITDFPSGKQLIFLRCRIQDNAAGSVLYVRGKGDTSTDCTCVGISAVANQIAHGLFFGYTDADGIIEIKSDPAPSSWTAIDMAIKLYRDV